MQEVANEQIYKMFLMGCANEVMSIQASSATKTEAERLDLLEKLRQEFNQRDGKYREDVENHCRPAAALYQREGRLAEVLIQSTMDDMSCSDVYVKTRDM